WPPQKRGGHFMSGSAALGWRLVLAARGALLRQRDRIDLLELLGRELPGDRLHILLELLGPGRAGDDAGHHRLRCEPGEGELEQALAARRAEGCQTLEAGEIGLGQETLGHARLARQPRAFGRRLARLVFAGEQAAGQRKEGEQAHAAGAEGGDDLGLHPAVEQAVFLLAADEAAAALLLCGPMRLDELPGGEIGGADIADLALPYEVLEGPQGLLDRRLGVGLVQLE